MIISPSMPIQGLCCIDEFDKMTHEHQALLEAMEQQSVSIAKVRTLSLCNKITSTLLERDEYKNTPHSEVITVF